MIKGETPDISIFCFSWFSPVWFYASHLYFPTDRMRPVFILVIAHNVGDVFSYELLAVYNYCDIPTYGRFHTVIHSLVRKCELTNKDKPTIFEGNGI